MADDIDSIVKGAPAQNTPAAAVASSSGSTSPIVSPSGKQGDPLNHAPSSPTMVYLNMLILEASMRAQYLELRARRRHHTFFMVLLATWITFFGYQLFLAPREDGRGIGGSIYWAVEGAEKVCFMGGIITAILVWAAGIWERGIRWPRRWFTMSNRGLRGFNCKLVIIRRPWWAEALSTAGFFLTYGLFSHTASSSYRLVDPSLLREVEKDLQITGDTHPTLVLPPDDADGNGGHEEDLAPGGDYVKLLLLAKPFSPTFRENWELYRTEYWERENERRALLRKKVKDHDRRMLKQSYGCLWWLPGRRLPRPRQESPRIQHAQHQHQNQHHGHQRHPSGVEKERKRRSSSVRRGSTSSSRSQTPTFESGSATSATAAAVDDQHQHHQTGRKASSSSSTTATGTSDKRRKKSTAAGGTRPKRPGTDSRSVTPEIPSPLAMETKSGSEGRVLRKRPSSASSLEA